MTEFLCTVGGYRVTRLRLNVPNAGAWFADVELDEEAAISGSVELSINGVVLRGSAVARQTGSFVSGTHIRVVGGANGWGSMVRRKTYHNDAGVKSRTVAEDAAREVGETLGAFAPASERIGADYVRRACVASRVLEDASGGVIWWVGLDGATNVGERLAAGSVSPAELLEYEPRTRIATLVAESVVDVIPGSRINDPRLSSELTIRELELEVTGGQLRATCWCGGAAGQAGRLAGLVKAISRRATDRELFGLYRYRVVSMAADGRVNLQAVKRNGLLPDILPVAQRPGVAGAHAQLSPGAEVLVQFIEGDPTQPIITGYTQHGDNGFAPTLLTLLDGTRPVARVGDQITCFMAPGTPIPISGTVQDKPLPAPPSPFVATIIVSSPIVGVIASGNPKVTA